MLEITKGFGKWARSSYNHGKEDGARACLNGATSWYSCIPTDVSWHYYHGFARGFRETLKAR